MKGNWRARQFKRPAISSDKKDESEDATATIEPPVFQMKAYGQSFPQSIPDNKSILTDPINSSRQTSFSSIFSDINIKHFGLAQRVEKMREVISLYKYYPAQLEAFEGLDDGPAGYLTFKLFLDDEQSLYSELGGLEEGSPEYNTKYSAYLGALQSINNKLDLMKPVADLREKYDDRMKVDVNDLMEILGKFGGAYVSSDKLFRILQFSFPYKEKRDALYKSMTGRDLYTDIRTQLLAIKSDFKWSMAEAYLVAGKLRPADKFYIAVKNAGTDESNVYFAMREGHSNIEQLEQDYTKEYESDLEGKSWLPHTGYGVNKWNIAGRLEGDMKGDELVKAKCILSYGTIRPIDEIKMAQVNGDKNALIKALRNVQGIELEKLEKNASVCYAHPETMVRAGLEEEYQKSWGRSLSATIKDVIYSEQIKNVTANIVPSVNDLSLVGSVLTGNMLGTAEAMKVKEEEFKNKTQPDIDLAEKILSGKEDKKDRFYDQVVKGNTLESTSTFVSMSHAAKKELIDGIESFPFNDVKMVNKLKLIYNLEHVNDPGYAVLKRYNLFDKDSFDRTVKYSIAKPDFDQLLKSSKDNEFRDNIKTYLFDSNVMWRLFYTDNDLELFQSIIASKDKEWVTHYLFNLKTATRRAEFSAHAAYFFKNASNDIKKDKDLMLFVMNLLENNYAERVKAERKLLTKANSGFGASITNAFSTSGLSAENEQRELEVSLEMAGFDNKYTSEEKEGLEGDIDDAKATRENFESTRDQIEGIATMIVQTAITIAAGIIVPGAGSILAAAVMGGLTSVGTNLIMKGDRYDASQAGKDLIMGGIDGAMGAFAVMKVKNLVASGSKLGLAIGKREIYKSIAQEVIGNSHTLAIDLANGEGLKGAMLNYGQSIAMGVGMDKLSNTAENLIKKNATAAAGTDVHDNAGKDKTDQDESHGGKDENDSKKDPTDQDTKTKTDDGSPVPVIHGGEISTSHNESAPAKPVTDQDILQMIREIGDWDAAVKQLKSFPEGQEMIKRMQRIRENIEAHFRGEEFNGHQRDDATRGIQSDMDFNFHGENAGHNMQKAEAWLNAKYGDDWQKLLKMNLFTDGSRLSLYTDLKDNPSLNEAEYKMMEASITDHAEKLNLARMLQQAQGNENSMKRVQKLLDQRSDAADIRKLAENTPQQMKEKATALHLEIDALVHKYNNTLDYKAKSKLAEKISKKQAEANFYTQEAYIGAAALKGEGAKLNDEELTQALSSQLAELESTIKSYGSSGEAAKEYEVYKYIHRYIAALRAAGKPVSPRMQQFEELSFHIYKTQEKGGELGRDFNQEKPEGSPGSHVNRRSNEDRAKVMDMFLDEAYEIVGNNMAGRKSGNNGGGGGDHGNTAHPSSTVHHDSQHTPMDSSDAANNINAGQIHEDPSFDPLRKALKDYENIGDAIAKLQGSTSFRDQHLLEELLHYRLRVKLDNLPKNGLSDLPSQSVVQPKNSADAFRVYDNMVSQRRDLETAVFRNPITGEYFVVQGHRNEVSIINDRGQSEGHTLSKDQPWHELLDNKKGRLELLAHSHPVGYDGKVSHPNRLPSGERGDFGVLIRESIAAGNVRRTSLINYGDGKTEGFTRFTFDPYESNPLIVEFSHPVTEQRMTRSFADLTEYHHWMEDEFKIDMGPISENMVKVLHYVKNAHKAPRKPSEYPKDHNIPIEQQAKNAIKGYGSQTDAIHDLTFSLDMRDQYLALYLRTHSDITMEVTQPGGAPDHSAPDVDLSAPSAPDGTVKEKVEHVDPQKELSDPALYKVSQDFGDTNAHGNSEPRYYGTFELMSDGFVEADVKLRDGEGKRSSMKGFQLFSGALDHFRKSGQTVSGLRSTWGDGDNLAIFKKVLEQQLKLHPDDLHLCYQNAAKATHSFKWADGHGFSKMRFLEPSMLTTSIPDKIQIEFY